MSIKAICKKTENFLYLTEGYSYDVINEYKSIIQVINDKGLAGIYKKERFDLLK